MTYEDRLDELSVEELYTNGLKAINFALLGNLDLALEEFEYEDIATEAVTKNITTTYIERVYTFVMTLVRKVKTVLNKVWLKIKATLTLHDKDRETLISKFKELLHDKKSISPEDSKILSYINKHLAFFHTRLSVKANADRSDDVVRISAEYRKAMLNANETVKIKLQRDLTIDDISKYFEPKFDAKNYKPEFNYLASRGDLIYLLAVDAKDPVFGTGVSVVNAHIKNKYKNLVLNNQAITEAKRLINLKWIYYELKALPSAKNLYRTVTVSLFDELEAIEHDLESFRLRELKRIRTKDNSEVDDVSTHADNVKMHSEIARKMAGLSKALMYVANGMLSDWNNIIGIAKVAEMRAE